MYRKSGSLIQNLVSNLVHDLLTSWLVFLDHSRVDKVVIGYDARPDDGSHDEVKHPLRDRIDLAGRKEPLVAPTALAQL